MDLGLSYMKVLIASGLKASAVGIVAAMFFGYLCSLVFKPQSKR